MPNLHIHVEQLNFKVGAFAYNKKKILDHYNQHQDNHCLTVFPELALCGYPPEDLLLRNDFRQQSEITLRDITKESGPSPLIIGHPHWDNEGQCYNAASLIQNGNILKTYHKQSLPNYTVFDEKRYFNPGSTPAIWAINGFKVAILICEDLWHEAPISLLPHDTDCLICINASPFSATKNKQRITLARQRVNALQTQLIYCNLVGGQDELVFDGGSFTMDQTGEIIEQAPFFEESKLCVELQKDASSHDVKPTPTQKSQPNYHQQIYKALVLGVRDYVQKNHFPGALIGLSGGIDSALTLAIAVDALGADKVEVILMPSRYTAEMSNSDAITMAQQLNVKHHIIGIEPLHSLFTSTLSPYFNNSDSNADENIQARIRGNILMYHSNQNGKIVLTTGNKSELAVGYCTLYGDMSGGFSVLKDILKTDVYKLAVYRNTISNCIPENIITRAPSAELREDQTDQDSLPPYDILDGIIEHYVNQDKSMDFLIREGYDKKTVNKIIKLIKKNEYKRRQAPIGIRICDRAFGKDRRYPITSDF